ncbi:hypothetical protein BDV98DRAFT_83151 [Pterulicium gracile]|uniref:Wings apart-like protein C-terminal domain-containing protein n=1 Tax=Pterulicium gracile TaxID=1884261 RepID=A0A5C3PZ64_9AGAR|nr:hypothetical protein BDV98DRAFT_83151 [Pterula gracilis]
MNDSATTVSRETTRSSKRRKLDVGDNEDDHSEYLTRRPSANRKVITYGKSKHTTRPRSTEQAFNLESTVVLEDNDPTPSNVSGIARRKAKFAIEPSAPAGPGRPLPRSSKPPSSNRPPPRSPKPLPRTQGDPKPSSTPVEDYSHIFDLVQGGSHSSDSPITPHAVRNSGVKTSPSGRLPQRKVTYSQTDPAIASPSTRPPKAERLSSSVPSIPHTPTRSSVSPVKAAPAIASGSSTSASQAPNVSRTYSGRSRSFLISVSSSQYNVVPGTSHLDDVRDNDGGDPSSDKEDADARESYASLRSRWGVDRSDDDPYHLPTLPSQQSVSSTESSPAKPTTMLLAAPPLPDGMMNDLKSTNELRSKGESRRFLDEVGYLFEGLEHDSPVGLKRSSALEILKKLCDADFAKKANATDFYAQTASLLYECGAALLNDKILNAIFVIFVFLVSRDIGSFVDLLRRPMPVTFHIKEQSSQLLQVLSPMLLSDPSPETDVVRLSTTTDIAGMGLPELKKMGLRRQDKQILLQISDVMKSITPSLASTEASTPFLITEILVAAPRCDLHSSLISHILSTLRVSTHTIQHQLDATKRHSSNQKVDDIFSFTVPQVINLLKLLDDFLLGNWASSQCDEVDIGEDVVGWLLDLCYYSELPSKHYKPNKLLALSLRLILNLTHDTGNSRFHIQFSQHLGSIAFLGRQLVPPLGPAKSTIKFCKKEEHHKQDSKLRSLSGSAVPAMASEDPANQPADQLCLVLGILTSLLQGEARAEIKDQLREITISSNCSLAGTCFEACTCPSKQQSSVLHHLANVYSKCQQSSKPEDVSSFACEISNLDNFWSFVRGHIAVLLGLLMQDCANNQQLILQMLPGSSPREKLTQLITQVLDFAQQQEVVVGSKSQQYHVDKATLIERSQQSTTLIHSTVDFLCCVRDCTV